MSRLTTDYIAELYIAANQVTRLTLFEKRRLIQRAVTTIRDRREQIDFSAPRRAPGDALDEIAAIGRNIASVPDPLVADALLEAADMMRVLKILLDAKEEISSEQL